MLLRSWLASWRSVVSTPRPKRRPAPAAAYERLEDRTLLSTFTVNSTLDKVDTNPGNGTVDTGTAGEVTLRAAITEANAHAGADTIVLGAGTYTLTIGGINEDAGATGDLDVTGDLTITGAGAGVTIIDANQLDRIFDIRLGTTVTISGVTLTNGSAMGGGALVNRGSLNINSCVIANNSSQPGNYGAGGGIDNEGTININQCTFTGNHASQGRAGGLWNGGTATVVGSTFINNTADDRGGAIANRNKIAVTDSTFTGNTAGGFGGAIDNDDGTETVTDCTIMGNTGYDGGGLSNGGTLTVVGSTLANNLAIASGGGIFCAGIHGWTTVTNSTISGNRAGNAGAIFSQSSQVFTILNSTVTENWGGIANDGSMKIKNSIVAGNFGEAAPDISGAITSQGFNLIGNTSGGSGFIASDLLNVNPMLGPLQDNGGKTLTRGLLAGSPAIDAGTSNGAPATDQRGQMRPQDGDNDGTAKIDIGAFEGVVATIPPPPPPPGLTFTVNSILDKVDTNPGNGTVETGTSGEVTLRAAVMEANAHTGADTIVLGAGTYTLSLAGASENASATGDLDVTDDLTIQGAGAGVTTIDANQLDRVLQVLPGIKLTLFGVTITGGSIQTNYLDSAGGGILNAGWLTATNCAITGNAAPSSQFASGGGIYSMGLLSLTNCTISQNTSPYTAGGIYCTGQAKLDHCTVSNNKTGIRGGGIVNDGALSIVDSQISGNVTTGGDYIGGAGIQNAGTLIVTSTQFLQNKSASLAGAIHNSGTATISDATFSGNSSGGDGGAIANREGNFTVSNSQFTGNTSHGYGGAINNDSPDYQGITTIVNSMISGNSSDRAGGGAAVLRGALNLQNCTISNNTATNEGGGITAYGGNGQGTATNCTISANRSLRGGGLSVTSGEAFTLLNSTIADNQGTTSGGGASNAGTLMAKNTIIANNTGGDGPDLKGTLTSQGNNLIGNSSGGSGFGASDRLNVNPLLGPLQDNGGPTLTEALLAGSPALDAGTNSGAPATDQRGQARPFDADNNGTATVDIGAFELQVQLVNILVDASSTGGNGKDNGTADQFLVRRNGDNVEVLIDGHLSQSVAYSNLGKIVVTGSGDADSLVVDLSGGNPCPAQGIQFAAAGGNDSLQATGGTATSVTHTLTGPFDGTLKIDSSTITYTGTESLSDLINAANRTFIFGTGADTLVVSDGAAASDDVTRIARIGGNTLDFQDPTAALLLRLGDGDDTLTLSGLDALFAAGLTADGEAGNDLITAAALKGGVTLSGSGGNDTLTGGAGDDSLSGGDQNDQLSGAGGGDTLAGGNGDDTLLGGADRDSLAGGAGNDRLRGQGSTDTLDGGQGTDTLTETADVDFTLTDRRLIGQGADFLQSFEQAIIVGGAGNNTLDASGFSHQATLIAGSGDDSLLGGKGNDVLSGEDGNDTLDGGAGADSLDGGDGHDLLWGNAGADTLSGGLGNDSLDGGDGDDVLFGLAGNDVLNGRAGDDTLLGGDGDDTLLGGQGRDLLLGELGADLVNGQGGRDQVTGGGNGAPIDPNDHVEPEDIVFHL
jgi:hypothetical protein